MVGAEGEFQKSSVECLTVEKEPSSQSDGPTSSDEFQVTGLIRAIDFVAHDRVTGEGKMDPDLMRAAG